VAFTRRYEEAEPQRVNRWLAQSGVCSRREAEALIAEGRVSIDGETVTDPGRKIAPGQTLTLVDAPADDGRFTAVIHKPVGLVSAQPDPGQTPAVRLITPQAQWGEPAVSIPDLEGGLAPLGRLDMDSRGLLLLSRDGVLAKAVIGPESLLDKEYQVRVAGPIEPGKLRLLRHGLELDGRKLKPATVRRTADQDLTIILTEGRNRQIRRMCDLVGLKVVDLLRVRIGPLHLGDLPEGRWRPLAPAEREALIGASQGKT
jgi:23S rRNA pseudouridine2604 synthase